MRVGIRATRIIKTKAFDNVASNVYSKCICSCVCSLPWRESAHEGFTSSYEGGKWRVGRNTEEVGGEGGGGSLLDKRDAPNDICARTNAYTCAHVRALPDVPNHVLTCARAARIALLKFGVEWLQSLQLQLLEVA